MESLGDSWMRRWARCKAEEYSIGGLHLRVIVFVIKVEMRALPVLVKVGGQHSWVRICPFEGWFARLVPWCGTQGCVSLRVCAMFLQCFDSSIERY